MGLSREQKNGIVSKLRFLPDEIYIKLMYRARMGKWPNLSNPKTFNEKIQWLKLHDRKPIYTTMVDKYEAKKYVAGIIGEEYIIPTLGVWDRFEDIDFDSLPDQFVLKCTHDSGGLVICKDKSKLDVEAARKKINASLETNFYWVGREWPYKDVKPRIIAEQYMTDGNGMDDLTDYKVHNFNGTPKVILVCRDRLHGMTEDFYSAAWEHLDISRPDHPNSGIDVAVPPELQKMIEMSALLSKDSPFARTDFYTINGQLYFGEFTLFPASGWKSFLPQGADRMLGDWITLPVRGG